MSAWEDLSVPQSNDITYNFQLTLGGNPFSLAGYTVDIVLKASQTATDVSGTTFTTANGLTIVSSPLGKVSWGLGHQYTGTPGTQWYRLDAIDGGGNRTTFFMGGLTVQAV